MARPKKNMSMIKVPANGLQAARKRFKITFGKALQHAPGRLATANGSKDKPPAAVRLPAKPLPNRPLAPSPAAHEDMLAKAHDNLTVIKTQSGVDLTEKVKELIHLAREQGYLTNEDID